MAILTIWVHDRFTSETDTDSSTVSLHVNSGNCQDKKDKPFIFTKWIEYFKKISL